MKKMMKTNVESVEGQQKKGKHEIELVNSNMINHRIEQILHS